MNDDTIKGQWKQLSSKLKARWGKLTDDDLQVTDGNAEYLVGKLQERYGIAKDDARRQIKAFDTEALKTRTPSSDRRPTRHT